ncbi:DNA-processing protein DprA [Sulfurimonas sp.]|uniref:DNA-processing protein DprA n=1 Tax=Sulfurimonas sp. TaxID=2022749 RepID=UPI00356304F5
MPILDTKIKELEDMKKYPEKLFYDGNLELLKRPKISIVGSRRPLKYSKTQISNLASKLSNAGICVVSGGAMGIDAIAHQGAGANNTISVLPCGIDLRYPSVNKNLLNDIAENGLLLSQFDVGEKSRPYSFVLRNEVVVALGDALIVGEADEGSGTMRSVEFALEMGKDIYVLPHRIGESNATNKLLQNSKAKLITDIDSFIYSLYPDAKSAKEIVSDDFLKYCSTNPSYEDAVAKYPVRIFEAELSGEIVIKDGSVRVLT